MMKLIISCSSELVTYNSKPTKTQKLEKREVIDGGGGQSQRLKFELGVI